jgi:hypothetical protein
MAKLAPGELVRENDPPEDLKVGSNNDGLLRKAYRGDPPAKRIRVSNRDLLKKAACSARP